MSRKKYSGSLHQDINKCKSILEEIYSLIKEQKCTGEKSVMSSRDVCEFLGVDRRLLYQWKKRKGLKYYRVGRKVFYFTQDIKEFIKNNPA